MNSSSPFAAAAANGDEEFMAWGISYAVSEDLSVSYNSSTIDYETASTDDQEAVGISASYTMGSMTLAGVLNKVDNEGTAVPSLSTLFNTPARVIEPIVYDALIPTASWSSVEAVS